MWGRACPVFPGKRYLDWQLTDPAGGTAQEIDDLLCHPSKVGR